jgi:hypothetical protein
MAQAGGADPALIEAAFAAVRNHLVSASVA